MKSIIRTTVTAIALISACNVSAVDEINQQRLQA